MPDYQNRAMEEDLKSYFEIDSYYEIPLEYFKNCQDYLLIFKQKFSLTEEDFSEKAYKI